MSVTVMPSGYEDMTVADIKRVANEYLGADQSTTGWFIPITPRAAKK